MKLKVKLDHGAQMPTRAHKQDAGLDLYAPKNGVDFTVPYSQCDTWVHRAEVGSLSIDTGVHIEIPEGYVGFIKSKSGLNVKAGLTAEGVIDAGYTGSIVVKLYNHTDENYVFHGGEKIAQLVILPIALPELEQVDDLEDTERGDGGFGSTGK